MPDADRSPDPAPNPVLEPIHDRADPRLGGRLALAGLLVAGVAAIVLAMVVGAAADVLEVIVTPPAIVRAGLSGFSIVLGGWLLLAAIRRLGASAAWGEPGDDGEISSSDIGTMVRAVRLVFLSAASFTAAGAWLLGDPLPLVIALVIAGVDIVETSFLLLVASRR
jgi:hypothetical protein